MFYIMNIKDEKNMENTIIKPSSINSLLPMKYSFLTKKLYSHLLLYDMQGKIEPVLYIQKSGVKKIMNTLIYSVVL